MRAIIVDTSGGAFELVRGEPLLSHTLRWLKRYDVTEVALSLADTPTGAQNVVDQATSWGVQVEMAIEPHVVGTAGLLRHLQSYLVDTCLIVHAGQLFDVDLADLVEYHRSRDAIITIGLKHAADPAMEEMVECDSAGKVRRFVDRPASWMSEQRTASARLYLAEPAVLNHIPPDRPFDWEEHLIPLLLTAGLPVYAQLLDGTVGDDLMAEDDQGSNTAVEHGEERA